MLDKLRKKIDKIDNEMLELLNQRAKEVIEVSSLKIKNNLSPYSAERETNILKRLKSLNKGPLSSCDVENIFKEILSACRAIKNTLRIAYLGPQGTFTQLAAIRNFGKKAEYISAESISDCFEKVEKEEALYGVVPIENSTEGVINYTLDMFFDSNLKICSEVTLNISHSLLALQKTNLASIKHVYSKSEVFPQCRSWIARNLPHADLIPVSSTAKAALAVKKDNKSACIGNKILSEIYGLNVVASSIEDSTSNITRFLVIANNDSGISGNDKTSILCSAKDKVGALHDVLYSFKKYGINLTKIESRPSKKKPWEYYFFIDFEGHRLSPRIQKVLSALQNKCIFVKILGSYPKES